MSELTWELYENLSIVFSEMFLTDTNPAPTPDKNMKKSVSKGSGNEEHNCHSAKKNVQLWKYS